MFVQVTRRETPGAAGYEAQSLGLQRCLVGWGGVRGNTLSGCRSGNERVVDRLNVLRKKGLVFVNHDGSCES